MKRKIFAAIILIGLCSAITVAYFRNLNPPGEHTSQVMRNIPADASLILELSNDGSYYEIFKNNTLLAAIAGQQHINELDTLRRLLINSDQLAPYFANEHLFVSVHAADTGTHLLISAATKQNISQQAFAGLPAKQFKTTPFNLGGKNGFAIHIIPLNKTFYVVDKGRHVWSGSFSRKLAIQSAAYYTKEQPYNLLPAQQTQSALINLYVNYHNIDGLLKSYFSNHNNMPANMHGLLAHAVLSLNYKSDALMFNGSTQMKGDGLPSYLALFAHQKPYQNHIKTLLPSTTAWYTSYAIPDTKLFLSDVARWQLRGHLNGKRNELSEAIKNQTGVNVNDIFGEWLGHEFAVVTTRYQEKFGIIELKNGTMATAPLMNLSTQINDNRGRFNFNNIPFYMLGDAFRAFRRPYFMIIDNYLIIANSQQEIASYNESYLNRKFLVKAPDFNAFDNLTTQRSNVTFFAAMKNSERVFKRDLSKSAYHSFENNEPGWKSIYGASYQLTAADGGFYTNFCIALPPADDEADADTSKKTN